MRKRCGLILYTFLFVFLIACNSIEAQKNLIIFENGNYDFNVAEEAPIRKLGETSVMSSYGLDIENDVCLIADSLNGVSIFNVSNPRKPTFLSLIEYPISHGFNDVVLRSEVGYAASLEQSVYVFNISDPQNPQYISEVFVPSDVQRLSRNGNLLGYVGGDRWGLVNISNPAVPTHIGDFEGWNQTREIQIQYNVAFLSNKNYGFMAYNISDPYSPVLLSATILENECWGFAVVDDFAYIAHGVGVEVLDISNISNPVRIGHFGDFGEGRYYEYHSGLLCLGNAKSFAIVNVSNPINPILMIEYPLQNMASTVFIENNIIWVIDVDNKLLAFEHDFDNDGLFSMEENTQGTNCMNPDSDADQMPDGWEVDYDLNPLQNDSYLDLDEEGLVNFDEYLHSTKPNDTDSDDDLLSDYEEVKIYETNPLQQDSDSDGLTDFNEIHIYGTSPTNNDTDIDGMPDAWELQYSLNATLDDSEGDIDSDDLMNIDEFLYGTNPRDNDTESDGMPDGWEISNSLNATANDGGENPDGDGLTNLEEYTHGTNPQSGDSDSDGMQDGWEVRYELDPTFDDAEGDKDRDGLINLDEFSYGTNPNNPDTDGDLIQDRDEIFIHLTDPTKADTDGDSISDLDEIYHGTNPLSNDTDSDSLLDNEELFVYGTDPTLEDTDGDYLSDYEEIMIYGTDPLNVDTDSDGIRDGREIEIGSDPLSYDFGGEYGVGLRQLLTPVLVFMQSATIPFLFTLLLFLGFVSYVRNKRRRHVRLHLGTEERIRKVANILSEKERIRPPIDDITDIYPSLELSMVPVETYLDMIRDIVDEEYNEALDAQKQEGIDTSKLQSAYEEVQEQLLTFMRDLEPEKQARKVIPRPSTTEPASGVEVLRGCEVVGGVFEYKVKVQNLSNVVITDVTINIVAYPDDALEITGETSKTISRIDVKGFRSPQFIFVPTKDCVKGKILAQVSYLDHRGQLHTEDVRPYAIKSVCDLLKPLATDASHFNLVIDEMTESSEQSEMDWNAEVLLLKTKRLLKSKNFHIVDSEVETVNGQLHALIRAIAEGKYTKNRVALLIEIIGPVDGLKSSVRVEALGDDISMLPTAIDEVTVSLDSWICLSCGASLSEEKVGLLRSGLTVECHYCLSKISEDDYKKSRD